MTGEMKETRRRIKAVTKRLEKELGIGAWLKINHHFNDDGESDAQSVARWEYREGTVDWNLAACGRLGEEELELTAIHEYVHLLIDPVSSLVPSDPPINTKIEELATESVARVIWHALGN